MFELNTTFKDKILMFLPPTLRKKVHKSTLQSKRFQDNLKNENNTEKQIRK